MISRVDESQNALLISFPYISSLKISGLESHISLLFGAIARDTM